MPNHKSTITRLDSPASPNPSRLRLSEADRGEQTARLVNHKYYRGFTLIELIIYSGILAVVLMFTSEYLYSIGQARINNAARVEVAQAAQLIMNKIKFDVVNSSAISNPTGSGVSTSLNLDLGENLITYGVNDFTLTRILNGVSDQLSSNQIRVSDLSFNKIANPDGIVTIQMRFTLTSLAQLSGGRNVQESFQTTSSQR